MQLQINYALHWNTWIRSGNATSFHEDCKPTVTNTMTSFKHEEPIDTLWHLSDPAHYLFFLVKTNICIKLKKKLCINSQLLKQNKKPFLPWACPSTGTCCPETLQSIHLWRESKRNWTMFGATCSSWLFWARGWARYLQLPPTTSTILWRL